MSAIATNCSETEYRYLTCRAKVWKAIEARLSEDCLDRARVLLENSAVPSDGDVYECIHRFLAAYCEISRGTWKLVPDVCENVSVYFPMGGLRRSP